MLNIPTETRIWIKTETLDAIKRKYKETKGMSYTGVASWALNKLLTLKGE